MDPEIREMGEEKRHYLLFKNHAGRESGNVSGGLEVQTARLLCAFLKF